MIKIPFSRKFFLQMDSAKVPIKYRSSRILNLFDLIRPIIGLLKRINTSNSAAMYAVAIVDPSFSVIHQLKLAVTTAEIESIRTGSYLLSPSLISCIKV